MPSKDYKLLPRAPLNDGVLATTEGGAEVASASRALARVVGERVGCAYFFSFISHPTGALVGFSVTNQLPVTGANFLQVTGF